MARGREQSSGPAWRSGRRSRTARERAGGGEGVREMGNPKSIQDMEKQLAKREKIALALIEQCKSEGGMTVHDLLEVFKLALFYIRV